MKFTSFDYFYSCPYRFPYIHCKSFTCISTIGQYFFNYGTYFTLSRYFKELSCSITIGNIGCGNACGSPLVSTAICLLIHEIFFHASYHFSCAVSVFLTLCASMMRKVVFSFRPLFRLSFRSTLLGFVFFLAHSNIHRIFSNCSRLTSLGYIRRDIETR